MRAHLAGGGPLARARGVSAMLLRVSVALALSSAGPLLLTTVFAPGIDPGLSQALAAVSAALIVAASALLLRGRTVGVLMMCSASFAVAQLAGSPAMLYDGGVLLPGIVAGPLALLAIAGPAWRRLRA
jgi:hypothetical protein